MSDATWVTVAEAPNRAIGMSWGELLTQRGIPWRFPARNVAEILGNDFLPVSIAVPDDAVEAAREALGAFSLPEEGDEIVDSGEAAADAPADAPGD